MDLAKYAELFLRRAASTSRRSTSALLELERAPAASVEPVGAIFRAVHTMKGMSATMGYATVAALAHELETLLDRVRRAELASIARSWTCSSRRRTRSSARSEIDGRAATAMSAADSAAPARSRGAAISAGRACRAGESRDPRRCRHAAQACAHSVVQQAFATRRGRRRNRRDPAGRRSRTTSRSPTVDAGTRDIRHVDAGVRKSPARRRLGATRRARPRYDRAVELRRLRRRSRISARRARSSHRPAPARHADESHRRARDRARRCAARGELDDGARGDVRRRRGSSPSCTTRSWRAAWCRSAQVFDRFPRLVRDAARALGKQIEFAIEGKDIELDRSMLDEIGDPIVHLLRNAIDHGIEPPEVRVARGQAARPAGSRSSAARDRSAVVIKRAATTAAASIATRVLARAQARRARRRRRRRSSTTTSCCASSRARASRRPERSPTSRGAASASTRCYTRVRALGGAVDIRSAPGQGTTVTLRLPLTLAIVRALLARVGDETYAIPLTHVQRDGGARAGARCARVKGREVLLLRDEVLPLLRLRELVGLPRRTSRRAAIELEQVDRDRRRRPARRRSWSTSSTGQQEIVVKQFDARARRARRCSAARRSSATARPR